MSEAESPLKKHIRVLLMLAVFAAVIYVIARNVGVFGNVLLVLIGFGAVVLVHEFGHFVIAKLSDINVEAFSIGFPPTFVGIRRTERGYRIRILPSFFSKEDDESDDGRLSFTVGRGGAEWETEYRIGLIPVGGFVKMLGQEDVGTAETTDDPRSFANKPVGARMSVIAAGVIFNAISAVIIFMTVFLVGIRLMPPVVGAVMPGSPAAHAGLKPGDEVVEIDGKRDNLDFSNILIAAALSAKDEQIALKVKHEDGSIEDYRLVPKQLPGSELKAFGLAQPLSLTIAEVSDPNKLDKEIGLLPGDRIRAINGTDVQAHWELEQIVENALEPSVAVLAERTKPEGKGERVESRINLDMRVAETGRVESESDLSHIYSMVPRLRITEVLSKRVSVREKLIAIVNNILAKVGIKKKAVENGPVPMRADVILAIGDVENPTYADMNDVAAAYESKELPMKVLRADANGIERVLTVIVRPERRGGGKHAKIGIGIVLDAEHPVVAKTITAEGGRAKLEIPSGAVITAVDGVEVSSFYDVIREIRRCPGERITIDYRLDKEVAGDVVLDVGMGTEFITVKSGFSKFVPFKQMRRLYRADNPIDAIVMGYKKTVMFIAQTYVTLRRLISGLVEPETLMGPVGIITLSYRIVAEQPLVYYFYFLGLISACIAVFNFLPLLPFDGGQIVFLLIEKIKGSPVNERAAGIAGYVGWVLVGTLFIYVTFNDIVRSFFG